MVLVKYAHKKGTNEQDGFALIAPFLFFCSFFSASTI